jgi:hypothetical protein
MDKFVVGNILEYGETLYKIVELLDDNRMAVVMAGFLSTGVVLRPGDMPLKIGRDIVDWNIYKVSFEDAYNHKMKIM